VHFDVIRKPILHQRVADQMTMTSLRYDFGGFAFHDWRASGGSCRYVVVYLIDSIRLATSVYS
jgi:hypothetical protein